MKIVCVLKTGGDFAGEHVVRLYRQVGQHGKALEFECLTDNPAGILEATHKAPRSNPTGMKFTISNLWMGWPGWWSMIEMFRVPGPAIYMDLDTMVRRSLAPFVGEVERLGPDELLLLRPWNVRERSLGRYATGLVGWNGDMTDLFKGIAGDAELFRKGLKYRGRAFETDQELITFRARELGLRISAIQDRLPGFVQSFKRDLSGKLSTATGHIVCYHGKPRPWEVGS